MNNGKLRFDGRPVGVCVMKACCARPEREEEREVEKWIQ